MDTSPQPQAPHEIAAHQQQYHYRQDVHAPATYNQMSQQYPQQPHNFTNGGGYAPAPAALSQPAQQPPQILNVPSQPQQPAALPPAVIPQASQIQNGAANALQLPNPMKIGANGAPSSGASNATAVPPEITLISKVENGRKYEYDHHTIRRAQ